MCEGLPQSRGQYGMATLLALVISLQVLGWTEGTGKIAARFIKYRNPEGKRLDGYCCDKYSWWGTGDCKTGDVCDPGFIICLGNITQSSSIEACEYGRKDTGQLSLNTNDINFDQTIGQVNNPLVFEFNEWPGLVKLNIMAFDADSSDKIDIVDTFGYQHNQHQLVRELDTSATTLQLSGSRSSLDLELKVFCDTNYYGEQCSRYCEPKDDDTGHFMCDPITGDRNCLQGWMGEDCLTNRDDCVGNRCYYGATCQDAVNSYTCVCPIGRTGLFCEAEINECTSNPCQNGGSCKDGRGFFYCECPVGTKGEYCQIDVSECVSDPCQNNATCVDHINAYECVCEAGYTGDLCEEDIDECASGPCVESDKCEDLLNDYHCVCRPGFAGKNCDADINECQSMPCQNNGLCVDEVNGYSCRCRSGTSGDHCEVNFDECKSGPCLNGGTCQDHIDSFSCDCPITFTGEVCETKIEPCDSLPCRNGGSCINAGDNFTCECFPGFAGQTCEEDVNECDSDPCQNGGTCSDLTGRYECLCPEYTSGDNCEYIIETTTLPTTVESTMTTVTEEMSTVTTPREEVSTVPTLTDIMEMTTTGWTDTPTLTGLTDDNTATDLPDVFSSTEPVTTDPASSSRMEVTEITGWTDDTEVTDSTAVMDQQNTTDAPVGTSTMEEEYVDYPDLPPDSPVETLIPIDLPSTESSYSTPDGSSTVPDQSIPSTSEDDLVTGLDTDIPPTTLSEFSETATDAEQTTDQYLEEATRVSTDTSDSTDFVENVTILYWDSTTDLGDTSTPASEEENMTTLESSTVIFEDGTDAVTRMSSIGVTTPYTDATAEGDLEDSTPGVGSGDIEMTAAGIEFTSQSATVTESSPTDRTAKVTQADVVTQTGSGEEEVTVKETAVLSSSKPEQPRTTVEPGSSPSQTTPADPGSGEILEETTTASRKPTVGPPVIMDTGSGEDIALPTEEMSPDDVFTSTFGASESLAVTTGSPADVEYGSGEVTTGEVTTLSAPSTDKTERFVEDSTSVDITTLSQSVNETEDSNVTDLYPSTTDTVSESPVTSYLFSSSTSEKSGSSSPAFVQLPSIDPNVFGNIEENIFTPQPLTSRFPLFTFPNRDRFTTRRYVPPSKPTPEPSTAFLGVTSTPGFETSTLSEDLESMTTWLFNSLSTISNIYETTTERPKETTEGEEAGPPPPATTTTTASYPTRPPTTPKRGDIDPEPDQTTPKRTAPTTTTLSATTHTQAPPRTIAYPTNGIKLPIKDNSGKGTGTAVIKPSLSLPTIRTSVYHTVKKAYNVGKKIADAAYKKAQGLLRRTVRRLSDLWKMCQRGALKMVYVPYNYARNVFGSTVNRGRQFISNTTQYLRARLRNYYSNAQKAMSKYYNYLRGYYKKRYNYYYTQYYNYYRNLKNKWWSFFG